MRVGFIPPTHPRRTSGSDAPVKEPDTRPKPAPTPARPAPGRPAAPNRRPTTPPPSDPGGPDGPIRPVCDPV